jgi:hypothetical protein
MSTIAEVAVPATEAVPATRPYGWILHPAIDLLFTCGGLVWVFSALNYGLLRDQSTTDSLGALALFVTVLTHLFSNSHTAATLVRAYQMPERKQLSFYTQTAAVACAALGVVALFVEGLPAVLLKIYLLWVIQHYTAQTYGIALIYCYKRGYFLNAVEKRTFWLLMYSTAAYAILRQFVYIDWGSQRFLYHQVPFWGPLPVWTAQAAKLAFGASAVAFTALIARKAWVEGQWFPFPALFVTVTGVAIHFVVGSASQLLWLWVPALYHGSQYIVVTTAFWLKERGLPPDVPPNQIAHLVLRDSGLRYLGLLLVMGAFIYVGLPRILEELGVAYTTALASVFAVFNIHHFLTDGAIWRLRDPRIRKILLA